MITRLTHPLNRRTRAGFTLLEVMIVGVLISVLMLGIFSLFRTWTRMYERGDRRVQAAQLVRSLCDQFTDDVRSVAQVSAPTRSRGGGSSNSGSRRRRSRATSGGNLALQGGSNWLVLEVLQPPSPFLLTSTADPADSPESETTQLRAPELQWVMYTFEPPPSEELDSLSASVEEMAALDDTELVGEGSELEEPFSGLLRLVVPKEQLERWSAQREGRRSPSASSMRDAAWELRDQTVGLADLETGVSSLSVSSSSASDDSATQLGPNVIQDEVPEVIWMEFRYFDGSAWSSSWDSRAEGGLPVAIEMRFELRKEEPDESSPDASGETELVDDGLSDSDMAESSTLADADLFSPSDSSLNGFGPDVEETPYRRCVVFLQPE